MDSRAARMTRSISTKASRLLDLKSRIRGAIVPELLAFTVGEWTASPEERLARIRKLFADREIIVRSSALVEDQGGESFAGAFRSIGRVEASSDAAVRAAVESVVASYGRESRAPDPGDQILVQEFLSDVSSAGVIFTRDPRGGAPYFVIGHDESGATDRVTSGSGGRLRYIFRDAPAARASALARLGREVEEAIGATADLEYAQRGDRVYLLQARPLHCDRKGSDADDAAVAAELDRLAERFRSLSAPHPLYHGSRTILGVMPDWNPAEMIGTEPTPLAASLYAELITESTWREARAAIGYAHPSPAPLMSLWAGRPYIDCRASFHSFLPADVPAGLAHRLVDFFLDTLERHPERHDKVEFEVVPTCMTFRMEEEEKLLRAAGFSTEEVDGYFRRLHRHTDGMVKRGVRDIAGRLEDVRSLTPRRAAMMAALLGRRERARLLIEDARSRGVLPFSILARYAFVGTALLRSLESVGALAREEREAFLVSIRTVAGELVADMDEVRAGRMPMSAFLKKHGHLRPGTYDIRIPRYDEDPDRYFHHAAAREPGSPAAVRAPRLFWLTPEKRARIEDAIRRIGFSFSPEELLAFIRESIRAREYAKYEFTVNVSDALTELAQWGREHDLSPEELSRLRIERYVRRDEASDDDVAAEIRAAGPLAAPRIRLPALICRPEDFYSFEHFEMRPNFIGDGCVTGAPLHLAPGMRSDPSAVRGRILFIASADPGYDWIFACAPAGLVTKYGGANSHMAIRAAEFRLPAAIGCGDPLFDALAEEPLILLDCRSCVVKRAA